MNKMFILIMFSSIILSCSDKQKDIELGFIGTLSGRYSEVGVSSRNGANLAIEQINKANGINGRKISIVSFDDKNDLKTLKSTFKSHIDAGRNIIIGPNLSSLAKGIEDLSKSNEILLISPTVSTEQLSGIDDSFFRTISTTGIEGDALAKKAIQMGLSRAAVIYDISNSAYTEPIYYNFKKTFEKKGQIVYVNHISNNKKEDYLEMGENVVSTNADMLLFVTTAIDAALIAQQARKYNDKILFFATRWSKTLDIISNGGQAVEGMVLSSMYTSVPRSEKYKKFAEDYYKKYNSEPSFVSAYAYETIMLLVDAIKQSNSVDVSTIKNRILSAKVFDGLEETIAINKFGDAIRKISMVKIMDGKFEVLND